MNLRKILSIILKIYWFYCKLGFKRFFGNVGYSRFLEYSLTFNDLELNENKTHLDIGSGKYGDFPLFLKYNSKATVYSIDILDYTNSQLSCMKKLGLFDNLNKKYFIKKIDARKILFKDQMFDSVSFVSTIEHIPNNGDSLTIKEVSRILKKNGKLIITVPFSPKKFREEFKKDEVYERRKKGEDIFFQRVYDINSIYSRLILPSNLKLDKIYFFGEKYFSIYNFWHKTPLFLNLPFRLFMPIFSIFFIHKIDKQKFVKLKDNHYYFAYILLRKE